MNSEVKVKRRFLSRQSDRIFLIIIAVLLLVTIVLNVIQRFGLYLINGAMTLYIPTMAVIVLLGWGGFALVRHISNRTVKLVVGGLLALVGMLGLTLAFSYVGFVATFAIPQSYTTVRSPVNGQTVVVLRALDPDEDRIEERKAARLAADPDGDPEVTVQDWGYLYRAYPRVLGLFYRQNADLEGEVRLAYGSGTAQAPAEGEEAPAETPTRGTLMVEWLDEGKTVHFFVDNPGPAEGGECTLHLD